jgi:hypothetical protein
MLLKLRRSTAMPISRLEVCLLATIIALNWQAAAAGATAAGSSVAKAR